MPARKTRKPDVRASAGSAPAKIPAPHILSIAVLWILSFAAYSNSFDGALIFDNAAIIGHDPRIRAATAANLGQIFSQGYWYGNPGSALYRPLTTLSYLFNYAASGLHPAGYHAINLILHDLNIALVYAIGLAILGSAAPAFALAAIWALHPLLTESVTNIVGRADLLAAFGVLGGLLCYLRATSSTGRRRIAWLAGLAAAQTIGIFSKENAAILPAILVLYDLAWPRAEKWTARMVPYALLAIPFTVYFVLRSGLHPQLVIPFNENPLAAAPFATSKLTAIKVLGKFLYLFLFPARLSADYSFNAVPLFSWAFPWETLIALLALAAMIAIALRERRRNPPIFFFLGFALIAFLPTSNFLIPIGSIMAERFMYLPALGLAAGAIFALFKIPSAPFRYSIAAILAIALAARTYARNADWRDATALWSSAIEAYPNAARPHNNLGNALLEKSDLPGAVSEFEAALRIRPDYAEAHSNLGIALAELGRLPEAIAAYEAALRDHPDYSPNVHFTNVHVNLGNALSRLPGRMPDAIAQYQAALEIDPDSAQAHYNLGNALARIPGRISFAIVEWQAAIRLDPELAIAHYNLATVYAQSGRRDEAVVEYQVALRLRPDYADAYNNLGSVYSLMPGKMPDAIAQFEQAIRLRPDFAQAHYNLGMALLRTPGQESGAIGELESALRLHPNSQGQHMLEELRARQKH